MRRSRLSRFTTWVVITFYLVLISFPIFWLISGSLKTTLELTGTVPHLIPKKVHFENYIYIWKNIPLARYFKNSLIIATSATFLSVFISLIGAYGFSRFEFPGRKFFGNSLLFTQLFPSITFLIPYYTMFIVFYKITGIRLIGSYTGIIFTMMVFALPVDVWLMKGYIDGIPKELEEAALIDGCNYFQAFFKIVFPLIIPSVAAVFIISFMQAWNEVLMASVLTDSRTRTLAIGILEYKTKYFSNWSYIFAAGVTISIPVFVLFTFLQRYIIRGLTKGALKG